MEQTTILLVEDETDVMLANQEYLEDRGMRVVTADTLAEDARTLEQDLPDIILLDINLPDGSGLEFIRDIRRQYSIPVVFLTCRTEKDDVITGLREGGSDYVTKPYDLDVLYARLTAQLRDRGTELPARLSVGDITLDIPAQCAFVAGEDVRLKPKEFALLLCLVQNHDTLLSGERLYNMVWGRQALSDTRTLRVHIHELRKKLGMNQENRPRIETVPGEGYCFVTRRMADGSRR